MEKIAASLKTWSCWECDLEPEEVRVFLVTTSLQFPSQTGCQPSSTTERNHKSYNISTSFSLLFFLLDKNTETFLHQEEAGTQHYFWIWAHLGKEESKGKLNA